MMTSPIPFFLTLDPPIGSQTATIDCAVSTPSIATPRLDIAPLSLFSFPELWKGPAWVERKKIKESEERRKEKEGKRKKRKRKRSGIRERKKIKKIGWKINLNPLDFNLI